MKKRPFFYGRMAVLFRQRKSREQVLGYLQKKYFHDRSLKEIEEMLNPSRGLNANLLSKMEKHPLQTFEKMQRKRKKLSVAGKKRFENESEREKLSVGQRKRFENESERKKLSVAGKKRFENESEREKLSVAGKKRFENESEREKLSVGQRKRFENESEADKLIRRKKLSVALKKYWGRLRNTVKANLEENGLMVKRQFSGVFSEKVVALEPTVLDELITTETARVLSNGIKSLPRVQQKIIRMFFYGNFSLKEISAKLKIEQKQVQIELSNAINALSQNPEIQELK